PDTSNHFGHRVANSDECQTKSDFLQTSSRGGEATDSEQKGARGEGEGRRTVLSLPVQRAASSPGRLALYSRAEPPSPRSAQRFFRPYARYRICSTALPSGSWVVVRRETYWACLG